MQATSARRRCRNISVQTPLTGWHAAYVDNLTLFDPVGHHPDVSDSDMTCVLAAV